MYLFDHAYPSAKGILQSRAGFKSSIRNLLATCREHCPDDAWDVISQYDYDAETQSLKTWWARSVVPSMPPEDVEVLWIAPHDFPVNFDLRGSTKWSEDPDNWQWYYHDDFMGPTYRSNIMRDAFELTDDEGPPPKTKYPADTAYEVVEMLFSLALFGLCFRELVRSIDSAHILGDRSSRWIVVGHPDSVYGIIMGKLTKSRWKTFHG